jgi:hypothetical protein
MGAHGKNVTMRTWWWNFNYNVNKYIQILLNTLKVNSQYHEPTPPRLRTPSERLDKENRYVM